MVQGGRHVDYCNVMYIKVLHIKVLNIVIHMTTRTLHWYIYSDAHPHSKLFDLPLL